MASDQIVVVNQLASRLENATSVERIDALQELQSHARTAPEIVGSLSLKKVLDFLQEQGSAEEYQEALDLIYRLVKCKDQRAAKANTNIILEDGNAIELLLDLLNHEDLTVGVMTSQILTEIHACNGASLEMQIQQCPDGMNKLLQRLPDSSREEVRNQAIVLIQQLTSSNEEMKKTVVFNEGFEILFGIIQHEGGYEDAGLVVQDCLHICKNILADSETCQRLFYAMGSEWLLKLADFFDPNFLENIDLNPSGLNDYESDDEDNNKLLNNSWYSDPQRLTCAILSLLTIYNSLNIINKKHQDILIANNTIIINSAIFWLTRCGPSELISIALSLLCRLVEGNNSSVGNYLSNVYIKVPPVIVRKNYPVNIDLPTLYFGWKPLPNDENKFISLLSLLAERYIFPVDAWDPENGKIFGNNLHVECLITSSSSSDHKMATGSLSQYSLIVLEKILSSDRSISDLIIQYILAPPPPPQIDGIFQDEYALTSGMNSNILQLEMMRPLGLLVLRLLMEGCNKVLEGSISTTGSSSIAGKLSLDTAERAGNVLSVVFIHGSQLAKELCTAITTAHTGLHTTSSSNTSSSGGGMNKPILSMLLFAAGRTARSTGVAGYPLLVSILRLLSCIAADCEFAAKQMLEDPANLFVVDLATVASESAGVPVLVQVVACLFLGCCFEALPSITPSSEDTHTTTTASNNTASDDAASILNRSSFLSMIDSRIGLSRFTDILKKPLSHRSAAGRDTSIHSYSNFFITSDFHIFYQNQVDAIRAGIFEYYTGNANSSTAAMGDAMQQQLIGMQKDRIIELEEQISVLTGKHATTTSSSTTGNNIATTIVPAESEAEIQLLHEQITQLQEEIQDKHTALTLAQEAQKGLETTTTTTIADLHRQLQTIELEKNNLLHEYNSVTSNNNNNSSSNNNDEMIILKQNILNEHEENKKLKEIIEQKERKLQLYFEELELKKATEKQYESKILDLENRNAELKQGLWEKELDIEKLTIQLKSTAATTTTTTTAGSDNITQNNMNNNSDFSEVPLTASPVPMEECMKEIHGISKSTLTLVKTLGLTDNIQEFYTLEEKLNSEDISIHQRCEAIDELLTQGMEVLCQCIGECSDITEGAGLYHLQGEEGTIQRALDCCRQLRQAVDVTATHSEDDSELEHLRLQIEVLERQLNESERDRIELNDSLIEMDAKLSSTQLQLEVITTETSNLSTTTDGVAVEAQSAWETERTTLQSENKNLETLLCESAEKVDSLTTSLAETEEKYRLAVRSTEDLQAQLEGVRSSSNQSTAEIRSELETVRAELLQAEHSVVDLTNQLTQEQHQTAQRLEELTRELTSQFEKEQATSALKLQQHADALTAELETARARLSAQESEHAQVLEQRVAELTVELETARTSLSAQETEHAQMLEQRVAEFTAELETARTRLSAQETEHTQVLEQRVAELTAELEAARTSLSAQETEHAQVLEQRVAEFTAELETARARLSAQETEHTQVLEQRVAELTVELETARARLSAQETEHAQVLEQRVAEFTAELETARTSLSAQETEHTQVLEQRVAELTAELEAARTRLSAQETEHAQVLEQRVAELTAELEAARASLSTQEAEHAQVLEQRVAELTAELEAARASLSTQEAEHAQVLEQRVAEFTTELETLRVTGIEKESQHLQCLSELQVSLEQSIAERENMKASHNSDLEKLIEEHNAAQAMWVSEQESLQAKLADMEALIESDGREKQTLQTELSAVRLAVEKTLTTQQEELDAQRLLALQYYTTMTLLQTEHNASQLLVTDTQRQREYLEIQLTGLQDELKTQSTEIATTTNRIEILQAELDALHIQYNHEVAALNDHLEAERKLSIQYSTELAVVRTKHEDDLAQQDKIYAELLISKEHLNNLYINTQNEINTLKEEEVNLNKNILLLKEKLNSEELLVTQLRSTYEASSNSNNALKSQEYELKRLTITINELSNDVNKKELFIQNIKTLLRRKEGEYEGLLSTYDSIKIENEQLRHENNNLNDIIYQNNKIIREKERELLGLQSSSASERLELETLRKSVASATTSSTSSSIVEHSMKLDRELLQRVESDLREYIADLITSHQLTDYKVTTTTNTGGKRIITITSSSTANPFSDLLSILKLLHICMNWIIEKKESAVQDKVRMLGEKEQEIAGLKRILLAFESSDVKHAENVLQSPTTPVRGSSSSNNNANAIGALSAMYIQQSTPPSYRPPVSSSNTATNNYPTAGDILTTPTSGTSDLKQSSSVRWSGAKSVLQQISPAAKQAAKLHSEVLKERNKLSLLQEQHSDLLGLLAQQDVELSVFRDTIQHRLGAKELVTVEDQARRNAVDMYGSYTQFRYDL